MTEIRRLNLEVRRCSSCPFNARLDARVIEGDGEQTYEAKAGWYCVHAMSRGSGSNIIATLEEMEEKHGVANLSAYLNREYGSNFPPFCPLPKEVLRPRQVTGERRLDL